MANIDISDFYVHVAPTMDIFTCIFQEIKLKGGEPFNLSRPMAKKGGGLNGDISRVSSLPYEAEGKE